MEQHCVSYSSQKPNLSPAMLQQTHERLQAARMSRAFGSDSSFDTMVGSGGSYSDRHCSSSPSSSSFGSPISDCDTEGDLPPFNIEEEGDPRISWIMYYDFMVTKTEAYYKLRPGYIPSERFPQRIESNRVKGDKKHPCGVLTCLAKPFSRHYDLERHFKTIHKRDAGKNDLYCDYPKCDHKIPLRKDHCREHYREYHMEDLLKRREHDVDAFLSSRVRYVEKQWWRCVVCLNRVKASQNGWKCPDCGKSCEPERQTWREKAYADDDFAMDDVVGCGMCQNAWLPDLQDPNGRRWVSCPTCQPGPSKTAEC